MRRAAIKDLADVRTGYQFRGGVKPAADSPLRVVQIKDVDEAGIRYNGLAPVRLANPTPYLLRDGEVLFLSRGSRMFAVPVASPPPDTVATGYFFILRPVDGRLAPAFLAWYINQSPFQDALRGLVMGTHIPLVAKSAFVELEIAIPPIATQERIVAVAGLAARERRLAEAQAAMRSALAAGLCLRAAHASEHQED